MSATTMLVDIRGTLIVAGVVPVALGITVVAVVATMETVIALVTRKAITARDVYLGA